MRLKVALETHKLKLAEAAARRLHQAGQLNDHLLGKELGISATAAQALRKKLQGEGRYPGPSPRAGRPRRHPPGQTDWSRRVARMRDGTLTDLESRAVTLAVQLAGARGVVPIPELAEGLGVSHTKAARTYTALKQAGLCRWSGSDWTKPR
ncbi:hypothetical protein AB1L88_15460 [Tautonia sp. JC769]|uniref:hypothetical protein n=1 Tax=Tautonia sp. JC769 TaxID=3232135 RepID=UPI003457C495